MAPDAEEIALVQFGFNSSPGSSLQSVPVVFFLGRVAVMELKSIDTTIVAALLATAAFISDCLDLED